MEEEVDRGGKGVLLDKGLAVLADEDAAVDVGIDSDTEIGLVLDDGRAELAEVLGDGLGETGELAGGLGVEADDLAAEAGEDGVHGGEAGAADAVQNDLEVVLADGLGVDVRELEDLGDVAVDGDRAVKVVEDAGEGRVVELGVAGSLELVGEGEHLGALVGGEEEAVGLDELETVPGLGVVGGGDDDAGGSLAALHHELDGGRRDDVVVLDGEAGGAEGVHDPAGDLGTAHTAVAAEHDEGSFGELVDLLEQLPERRHKPPHHRLGQTLSCDASHTANRHHQRRSAHS